MTTRQSIRNLSAAELAKLTEMSVSQMDLSLLRQCLSERGAINSARKNGMPVKLQRRVRRALLRARYLALLPYVSEHRHFTTTLSKPADKQLAASAADDQRGETADADAGTADSDGATADAGASAETADSDSDAANAAD